MDHDFQYLGLDLSPASIEAARAFNAGDPRLSFECADILLREPQAGWADLALSLEVLEHLPDPAAALERVGLWSRGEVLVSVPWEPWFRIGNLARGRHVRRLGNHPEHIQQFNPRSLRALMAAASPLREASVEVTTCFPWLIGAGAAKRQGR
jgi:SAM-dependent methyltransferase